MVNNYLNELDENLEFCLSKAESIRVKTKPPYLTQQGYEKEQNWSEAKRIQDMIQAL
jgi:hypothetical protein